MKQYNGSTTQYYIDFTFNSHAAANEHNGIDLFSFYVWGTNKPSEGLDFIKRFDKKSELQGFLGNDNRKRGVRLRAIYDTDSKTLTLKGLHREYNPETATVTWAETSFPDMLPFWLS